MDFEFSVKIAKCNKRILDLRRIDILTRLTMVVKMFHVLDGFTVCLTLLGYLMPKSVQQL